MVLVRIRVLLSIPFIFPLSIRDTSLRRSREWFDFLITSEDLRVAIKWYILAPRRPHARKRPKLVFFWTKSSLKLVFIFTRAPKLWGKWSRCECKKGNFKFIKHLNLPRCLTISITIGLFNRNFLFQQGHLWIWWQFCQSICWHTPRRRSTIHYNISNFNRQSHENN